MIIKDSTQKRVCWDKGNISTELNTELYPQVIIEGSIFDGIKRRMLEFHGKDPHEIELLSQRNDFEENQNLSEVQRLYGFRNTSHYSKKTQRWIGYVTEIKENSFFCRLVDLTNQGTEEFAEFDSSEISPEDKLLLQKGAIFYWSIGDTMSNGQLKKESILRFRRNISLTTDEIDTIEDRAEERFKNVQWI